MFVVSGDEDELQTGGHMSHCAFMGRCREQINMSAVDLVCSVDDIRMMKTVKSIGTLFHSATHPLWFVFQS